MAQPLRPAIEYLCRLLASYDIQLTAETLRQAKFDVGAARAPLLRALHDLALAAALGWPRAAGAGVGALRARLREEALDDGGAPPEGRVLLLHLLASWGCPPGLAARLAAPHPSSRALLLALAWLIAHCGLFERALAHLAPPRHLAPLLPPLPQDPSAGPAAAAARAASAAAAAGRAARGAALRGGLRGWARAEAAAQQALAALGGLRARAKALACLLEGREKMWSPYELLLALSPRLLARHEAALAAACGALERQAACAAHASVFFAWAGSALEEERRAAAAAGGVWPVAAPGGAAASGGGGGAAVSLAEVVPLVDQLPPLAEAAAARHVLERVCGQLERAAAGLAGGVGGGGEQLLAAAADGLELGGPGAAALPECLQPFAEAAAAALDKAGLHPLPEPALASLPPDLRARLDPSEVRRRQRQQEEEEEEDGDGDEALAAGGDGSSGGGLMWRRVPVPAAGAGAARAAEAGGCVAAEDDLERLRLLALAAAKHLARARAANKQRLAAAAAALFGAGAGGGGGGGGQGAGACDGCILIGGL
ncbi:MAG: hypothetical protein J3K34DRAFT_504425 [Monoraphidium minutum]|nr:MAG: hypothetical protein J3K34DRAFT_504425 [Monoraphidium minutum]